MLEQDSRVSLYAPPLTPRVDSALFPLCYEESA